MSNIIPSTINLLEIVSSLNSNVSSITNRELIGSNTTNNDSSVDLPKNRLMKYLENIKKEIPENIIITEKNENKNSQNFSSDNILLGLSNETSSKEKSNIKTPNLPRKKMQPPQDILNALEQIIDIEQQSEHLSSNNNPDNIVNKNIKNNQDSISQNTNTNNKNIVNSLLSLFGINNVNDKKKKFHLFKKGNSDIDREILAYIKKINSTIGYYWWKQYFYTAFWNYISTPINLSITIITALTTGQSATQGLISSNTATVLGGIVLFLSIFNTFFKPNDQMNNNKTILKKWADFGATFDNVYFDKVSEENKEDEKKIKLNKLQALFKEISQLKKDNDSNVCIDILFSCAKCIFLRNDKKNWMPEASAPDDDDI
jgi:hypothetical protein